MSLWPKYISYAIVQLGGLGGLQPLFSDINLHIIYSFRKLNYELCFTLNVNLSIGL